MKMEIYKGVEKDLKGEQLAEAMWSCENEEKSAIVFNLSLQRSPKFILSLYAYEKITLIQFKEGRLKEGGVALAKTLINKVGKGGPYNFVFAEDLPKETLDYLSQNKDKLEGVELFAATLKE